MNYDLKELFLDLINNLKGKYKYKYKVLNEKIANISFYNRLEV